MAVQLNFLEATPAQKITPTKNYLYKDLKLDLELEYSLFPGTNRQSNITDFKAITDYTAVIKSVANILTTFPGQKLLNPEFGLDLRRYLFESVNPRIAYLIGLDLSEQLPILEPRIDIKSVIVTPYEDDNTYVIEVNFSVPSITDDTVLTLTGQINSEGYVVV